MIPQALSGFKRRIYGCRKNKDRSNEDTASSSDESTYQMLSDDEVSHFTEEPLRIVKFISPETRAKRTMGNTILQINNLYYINSATLYLAM